MESCGYSRGETKDWPALVENCLLFWITISFRGLNSRSCLGLHYSAPPLFCLRYYCLVSAFLSSVCLIYQLVFSVVPGKISERKHLTGQIVTVHGPGLSCFMECQIKLLIICLKSGIFTTVQYSSVAQSCLILCDPMDRSTPGFPVRHQLLEFTQTHVH